MPTHRWFHLLIAAACACILWACSSKSEAENTLLHVSYDPTREFYSAYNRLFAAQWKQITGQEISIHQSHGGSGKQARAVIFGLQADVVSLALALDIDQIAEQTTLIPEDWQSRLPNQSVPFSSVIIFLVRKGNPKQIHDWNDLIKHDVQVVTPNPKTSGGARWNYLAAYGYALQKAHGDESAALTYMRQLFGNVPLLDTGARAAATTFTQRGIGDVLITWENEAYLVLQELGEDAFTLIRPSLTITAELPVAWIDGNIDRHGTRKAAEEYLRQLYSDSAQELAAKHYLRPNNETILEKYRQWLPKIATLSINDFGGWEAVQNKHFRDGGVFDQIYERLEPGS